ncbi:helix-turn-helix domain-containing protein [Lentibacillus sediminis]|uniref:helix-turn-helix domain-containing protein n=1 Tax=Lentibacillus sediminis TaxID=1940529 RepID=UPI001303F92A|nr:helix-turn-helix transcriptional regulator [Lentibacillus sediminis]
MSLEQIAQNIKFFREQYNWTQQELADRLQMSRSVITKWENNHLIPDTEALIKLSEVFQITLDQLVGKAVYQEDLLKEFKRIYSSDSMDFEEEVVSLVEYLMKHPHFKEQIYRLSRMSVKKQLNLHSMFAGMIDHYEKL